MDKKINSVVAQYVELIKKKFCDIEKIYLFGSFAKGISTEDSDIDLALIFSKLDESKRFEIQVQLMLLASDIDSRIEPHPFSLSELDSGHPFLAEIKRTGVEIAA